MGNRLAGIALSGALALAQGAAMGDEEPLGPARDAFREGRFVEAADAGEALGTSGGYALAAESLAIYGHYLAPREQKAQLLEQAMRLAQEAIRSDTGNPRAHLQSAHAMGRYTQAIGTLKVKRDYARQVRVAIEQALWLNPELAEAHLSLATWHAEAITGGGFMARMLFGASGKDAIRHYEAALELAPHAKIVHAEYALGLLLLGEPENREQARSLLQRAVELPVGDAHDRIIHELAVAKLAELNL